MRKHRPARRALPRCYPQNVGRTLPCTQRLSLQIQIYPQNKKQTPQGASRTPCGVVIYIVSGVIGGFFMGKIMKTQKFLWGFAAGAIYFCILFLISVLVKQGVSMELPKVATTFILCAASGMAGGMIS